MLNVTDYVAKGRRSYRCTRVCVCMCVNWMGDAGCDFKLDVYLLHSDFICLSQILLVMVVSSDTQVSFHLLARI